DKSDPADRTPNPGLKNVQAESQVDVLFFYPTSYIGDKRYATTWNAPIDHKQVNKRTDENSILYQASIFNGTGRVFAPRYRQAHLDVFFNKKKAESGKKALEVAYSDVVAAFDYYMQHWNNGRRFIIAGHSQGALHAMTLIKQKVEGTPLQNQLIAAYIIGWPVQKDYFKALKPCETADQTGCFCTWRTWNREYVLENQNDPRFKPGVVCTNPLLWHTQEGVYAPKTANKGGLAFNFEKLQPGFTDAEVFKGILLAHKPKFKGSILFRRKNYHIGDLNLYYLNVRENAQLRANGKK
ncbi:MAG: DUF3089 domain-containing protein, partial [Saprospiraceae bacterium]|nr:DUF3089 domain-containing protein [Saprospiraceae bacterium]